MHKYFLLTISACVGHGEEVRASLSNFELIEVFGRVAIAPNKNPPQQE